MEVPGGERSREVVKKERRDMYADHLERTYQSIEKMYHEASSDKREDVLAGIALALGRFALERELSDHPPNFLRDEDRPKYVEAIKKIDLEAVLAISQGHPTITRVFRKVLDLQFIRVVLVPDRNLIDPDPVKVYDFHEGLLERLASDGSPRT